MLSLGHIGAIIDKQIKDVSKNLQVLILFFVFPVIAVILTQSVSKDVSEYLVMIFATMHCVFTPLVTTASFISEEKEKNTLRVLIMSGVRPFEYFFSIAICLQERYSFFYLILQPTRLFPSMSQL